MFGAHAFYKDSCSCSLQLLKVSLHYINTLQIAMAIERVSYGLFMVLFKHFQLGRMVIVLKFQKP